MADHVAANRYQQMATILLVDDADLATTEVLDEIMRLAEFDAASDALTIVLAAQPQRLGRLGNRILELAELRIDLEGWEADDTATFVKRALAVAGRTTPVFAEPALRGCTTWPAASRGASSNWPIWRCWPAPGRVSPRLSPKRSTRCIVNWAWSLRPSRRPGRPLPRSTELIWFFAPLAYKIVAHGVFRAATRFAKRDQSGRHLRQLAPGRGHRAEGPGRGRHPGLVGARFGPPLPRSRGQGRAVHGVCILGTYLFGLYLSEGRAVYASWTENDKRLYYLCQVCVGLPALPAMLQTYLVRHGKAPLLGGVMAPPKNPGELNDWYRTLNSYLDLGTVYTTIAGLLNVLVIYDAWGGPVQLEEEEKKRKGPNESDEPAKE